MKIKWKKTKYILPVIVLPFLFLLNYGYQSFSTYDTVEEREPEPGLQPIGDVSDNIRKKGLADKLEAFKNRYRRSADGQTAIENLQVDAEDTMDRYFDIREQRLLDSIDRALEFEGDPSPSSSYSNIPTLSFDYQMETSGTDPIEALDIEQMESPINNEDTSVAKYDDPMVLFREQMKVIDSISKAGDPLYQRDFDSTANPETDKKAVERTTIPVKKASDEGDLFNTVRAAEEKSFIKAIVDEELKKGSMGERIAIRILDDIEAGGQIIPQGSRIYAQIAGFRDQRVKIAISTIMVEDKIVPVDLSVFDLDGMEGLYVPASEFREFSKELGSNSTGGMKLRMQQDPSSFNQFYMSSLQRMFTSTSQAVSKAIKQNRATLKYGTVVYLVGPEDLNP